MDKLKMASSRDAGTIGVPAATRGVEHVLEQKDSIYNFIRIAKIYGELNMCQENIPSTFHMLSHCILTTTLHYPYSRKPCVETLTPSG